jgi:hypothetical protein
MSRRMWLFVGVAFGFTIPILLNSIQMFGHWPVRPSAYFLFRPGLILVVPVARFLQRSDSTGLLDLLIFVANAVVFGAAAYGLRKGFVVLIAVLLVICYVSLPPSDAELERKFAVERVDFERLIQKASETPFVVGIGKEEIEDIDGKHYRKGDKQSHLSTESWDEYRLVLKKSGMNEGLFKSAQTGRAQFFAHTFLGKVGPIGTLYGYVHCPPASKALSAGLPCSGEKDTYDQGDYRYKRIAPEWFLVEIFETHSAIN